MWTPYLDAHCGHCGQESVEKVFPSDFFKDFAFYVLKQLKKTFFRICY